MPRAESLSVMAIRNAGARQRSQQARCQLGSLIQARSPSAPASRSARSRTSALGPPSCGRLRYRSRRDAATSSVTSTPGSARLSASGPQLDGIVIGTTVFGSLPGVASNEKTGSARAAPETTSTTASIAPTYRAKDAVSIKLHAELLCQPAQRDAGTYSRIAARNSRETPRCAASGCRTSVKRCPQMFTGSNDLTHDNFTTFFAVSPPRPSARVVFDGSAERR